jgi:hypothetical protein
MVDQAGWHAEIVEEVPEAVLRQVGEDGVPRGRHRFQDEPVELAVEGEHPAVKRFPGVVLLDDLVVVQRCDRGRYVGGGDGVGTRQPSAPWESLLQRVARVHAR